MTVRKALITGIEQRGGDVDGAGFWNPDGNPERDHIRIEGINCTNEEFLDWFLATERGGSFCSDYPLGFIDLGSPVVIDSSIGAVIEVSFEEYFKSKIDTMVRAAKHQVHNIYIKAKRSQGILTD